MSRTSDLLDALAIYRSARQTLLATVGVSLSNRDPLAEFAEAFVAALIGGALATNRVQAAWDIQAPDGSLIQVKYLANTANSGINEHLVRRLPGVDWYTLVLIEDFEVVGVLAFPPDLTAICAALRKKHPYQGEQLQFTRRNWLSIRDNTKRYASLGMRIWLPPEFI